jgi:hypothetical protein
MDYSIMDYRVGVYVAPKPKAKRRVGRKARWRKRK